MQNDISHVAYGWIINHVHFQQLSECLYVSRMKNHRDELNQPINKNDGGTRRYAFPGGEQVCKSSPCPKEAQERIYDDRREWMRVEEAEAEWVEWWWWRRRKVGGLKVF